MIEMNVDKSDAVLYIRGTGSIITAEAVSAIASLIKVVSKTTDMSYEAASLYIFQTIAETKDCIHEVDL